ncbi:uncharacterized protein SAPINGB_P004001 [Magnusiomyces paraingens]|uniref:Non-haem dioxygenase N-terminal domain-containing protein n=1 Tax=Magnusiomyces paraingens TaxID=2606893 RepID=A0A5E8BUG8_9ASCO|nr:uncharacterized protein SAPINGB_P004001 [Saprochaete ingens]VVT54289.1 unnamed protein product [Saprochaete ingens]
MTPIIDLQLAFSPLTRQYLIDALREALIHEGYFIITNYEDFLDPKIVSDVTALTPKFFNLPQLTKDSMTITKSRNFRGYYNSAKPKSDPIKPSSSSLEAAFPALEHPSIVSSPKPTTSSFNKNPTLSEQIIFGMDSVATAHLLTRGEPVKEQKLVAMLRGPNQYPSSLTIPRFKQKINKFADTMNAFSYKFVSELVTEALGLTNSPFYTLFEESPLLACHKIKLTRHAPTIKKHPLIPEDHSNKQQLSAHESPVKDTYGTKDDGSLFTFITPSKDASLSIIKPSGQSVSIPQSSLPANCFIVTASEYLSVLTQGFSTSAVLKVAAPAVDEYDDIDLVSPAPITTPIHVTSFSQCISIDFVYQNFTFPSAALPRAQAAQAARLAHLGEGAIKDPAPSIFIDFGMKVFINTARLHPHTTSKWYPRFAMRSLRGGNGKDAANRNSQNSAAWAKLEDELARLRQIFASVDASIVEHSISSIVPITLPKLRESAALNSEYLVDLNALRQINTIWPEAYFLSVSMFDDKTPTIQFGSSAENSQGTSESPARSAPRSPQKRKQVFASKCRNWVDNAFPKDSDTVNEEYLEIPLAPVDPIVLGSPRKRSLDEMACVSAAVPAAAESPQAPASTKRQRIMGLVRGSPSPSKMKLSSRPFPCGSPMASRAGSSLSFNARLANTAAPGTPRALRQSSFGSPSVSSSPASPSKVLERIRAKEQAQREEDLSLAFPPIGGKDNLEGGQNLGGSSSASAEPLSPYEEYVLGKLPAVAGVVIGLRKPRSAVEVLSLADTVKKIRDSLGTGLSEQETTDSLQMLSVRVPRLVSLTTVGALTSVRVYGGMTLEDAKLAIASYGTILNSDSSTDEDEKGKKVLRSARKSMSPRKQRAEAAAASAAASEGVALTNKTQESPLMTPPQTPTRRNHARLDALETTPMSARQLLRSAARVLQKRNEVSQ